MEGDLSQEAVVILNPGIGYNVADGHGHNQAKGSLAPIFHRFEQKSSEAF